MLTGTHTHIHSYTVNLTVIICTSGLCNLDCLIVIVTIKPVSQREIRERRRERKEEMEV